MERFVESSPTIALFVFNRPETTRKVIESLREVRPESLLVVSDGPRHHNKMDVEQCDATRRVIEEIDWKCEVHKNYAEENLGLGRRVATGLDWVFSLVDRAIILEDDCIVHPTFFRFCDELLDRYADDERVMHIAASNFQRGRRRTPESYYFSKYPHCWGWASWRRAWKHFDFEMADWPQRRGDWLASVLPRRSERRFWENVLDDCYQMRTNTWAARWVYACWKHNGLTAIPERNQVQNVGFGASATHTRGDSWQSRMPSLPVEFPLRHPEFITRHEPADEFTHEVIFRQSWSEMFLNKFRHVSGMEYNHNTPDAV